jgi:hypothetical protein
MLRINNDFVGFEFLNPSLFPIALISGWSP